MEMMIPHLVSVSKVSQCSRPQEKLLAKLFIYSMQIKESYITLHRMTTTRHYMNMWRKTETPQCQHSDADTQSDVQYITHDS